MDNIWLTSDTHLSHKKIIQYGRPENFEELIIKHLTNKVEPGDKLIHLGDISFGNDADNNLTFKVLNGQHILIRGNHDNKSLTFYNRYWDCVCDEMVMKYHGFNILFTHVPMLRREGIDFNVHGHLHTMQRTDNQTGHNRLEELNIDYDPKYHKLVSLEELNYQPILLNDIIMRH